MAKFTNKTIIITGASRGIGREFALKFAKEGANIVIAAKSAEPHPKLPGTIFSVAEEIEALGGKALPFQVDIRHQDQVIKMVETAVDTFGGIDGLINNAGAIKLMGVENLPLKRFDLMHEINSRGVFVCSQAVLPYLKKSENPHILNLSPPIDLNPIWFKNHAAYTLTKYGMSMFTIGMAEEFKSSNIAVNSLWPKTIIATAAIEFELGGQSYFKKARTPEIMADAAYEIFTTENCALTGQTLIDEAILKERGITDLDKYAFEAGTTDFITDLFVDPTS